MPHLSHQLCSRQLGMQDASRLRCPAHLLAHLLAQCKAPAQSFGVSEVVRDLNRRAGRSARTQYCSDSRHRRLFCSLLCTGVSYRHSRSSVTTKAARTSCHDIAVLPIHPIRRSKQLDTSDGPLSAVQNSRSTHVSQPLSLLFKLMPSFNVQIVSRVTISQVAG